MKVTKILRSGPFILTILIILIYHPFFFFGKIPLPADTLVGAYFPFLDYKWGYEVGVPVKNALLSDTFSQFYLWKNLAVSLLKEGTIPLWNPYSYSGTPFLAAYHSAVLLPFNLILLIPKTYGWSLFIFGQTLVASLGMYFLTGLYTKNMLAKISGALVFSLSGLMTTWVELGTGVWAASQLPWIFYFLESFFRKKNILYLFPFTISFLCLYLAGHAQLTVYSSVIFGLCILIKLKEYKKEILKPLFFWFLSLGAFAIQILPTLELTKQSIRASEAYSASFNYGLNAFYQVVRLFAPDFFGNPTTYNHWDKIAYHEHSSFLGAISLPLIIPLLFRKSLKKENLFWLGIFLVSLLLAFDNPLSSFLYSQPIPLLTYSSASRIFFLTSFAAGILVALGLTQFMEDDQFRKNVRRAGLFIFSILVGCFVGFFITYMLLNSYNGNKDIFYKLVDVKVTLKNIILPMFLLFILIILSYRIFKHKFFILIITLVLFFDLGRYFLKYNPFVDPGFVFPDTEITNFLKQQKKPFRIARTDSEVLPPNTWTAYNLESVEGYDPLSLESSARYFNKITNRPYESGISRYSELRDYPSKFLDAANVKYLLAVKRDEKGVIPGEFLNYKVRYANTYNKIFEYKNTAILENPNAKERAYFIDEVGSYKTESELPGILNNPKFDPTKKAVIVASYKPRSVIQGDSDANFKIEKAKIEKLNISPNQIDIQTNTNLPQFLVLANSFEKGWKAYEDGSQVELYKVNGGLQGFFVNPGIKNYKVIYSPKSFELGLKISIMSLFVYLLTLFWVLSRKLRQKK